mgnify:CR=1 FL=1
MNIEHVGHVHIFLIFCDVIENVLLKPESLKEIYLMTHAPHETLAVVKNDITINT